MRTKAEAVRAGRRTHVVFVGAGHASLHALTHAADLTGRGCVVTLVAPAPFMYSGIAAATLSGRYTAESPFLDVGLAVLAAGGLVVRRRAVRIDRAASSLVLEDGTHLRWDLLVLGAGSEVEPVVPGAAGRAFPVKPFTALMRYREALIDRIRTGTVQVTVMGGGPSACEIAANTLALARKSGGVVEVTLITAADRLIEHMPRAAAGALRHRLERDGAHILTGRSLASVEDGVTIDAAGGRVAFDLLVDATGLRAVPVASRSSLPTFDGALRVDRHLRAIGDARIFGGGDGVRVDGYEHVRPVGVHAVRQGPILLHNLLATLDGGRLRPFRPRRTYLQILDLGGTGLAVRNGLHWLGPASLRLKDRIDMAFLRRYGGDPRRID